jgi:uncharacterized protein
MNKIESILKNCKIIVLPETYSVLKVKKVTEKFFAIIQDNIEITAVAITGLVPSDLIIKEESDWRIITFDLDMQFNLVGFLAYVSKILAEENISIFVLSSFSTDHILLKNTHLKAALKKLQQFGCKI